LVEILLISCHETLRKTILYCMEKLFKVKIRFLIPLKGHSFSTTKNTGIVGGRDWITVYKLSNLERSHTYSWVRPRPLRD
jgi:hypothetical protein